MSRDSKSRRDAKPQKRPKLDRRDVIHNAIRAGEKAGRMPGAKPTIPDIYQGDAGQSVAWLNGFHSTRGSQC